MLDLENLLLNGETPFRDREAASRDRETAVLDVETGLLDCANPYFAGLVTGFTKTKIA